MKRLFIVAFFFAYAVPLAFAHGEGTSFETEVNNRLVDIGFDIPFSLTEDTLMDFALYDLEDGEVLGLADFSTVDVSIASGSVVQWEQHLTKPDFGKVFTAVTPEKSGNWVLRVRFSNEGKELVRAEFPMLIETGDPKISDLKSGKDAAMFGVIFLALSLLVFRFFIRRK